jgi:Polyketide cyclase / dehydrase and lipid transport
MFIEDVVSSDEVVIEAPAEFVWNVLIDFDNYGAWNEFCPSARATLEIGSPIVMKVNLGGNLVDQTEYICRIDPGEAIAWGMENKPGDPITAVRTQHVKTLTPTRCSYISIDEFGGPGMRDMLATFGQLVEDGFNLCGRCLKQYCEGEYARQKGESRV